jgi:hypothetical protein
MHDIVGDPWLQITGHGRVLRGRNRADMMDRTNPLSFKYRRRFVLVKAPSDGQRQGDDDCEDYFIATLHGWLGLDNLLVNCQGRVPDTKFTIFRIGASSSSDGMTVQSVRIGATIPEGDKPSILSLTPLDSYRQGVWQVRGLSSNEDIRTGTPPRAPHGDIVIDDFELVEGWDDDGPSQDAKAK